MALFRRARPVVAAYAQGSIEIRQPWARASALRARVGGYFTLANTGTSPDRLIAAKSPAARWVAVRGIKVVGPDIRMRSLEKGLVIPPETTLTLKPRGYHLLMIGMKPRPSKGDRLPVTLIFERAGKIDVEFLVEGEGLVGEETLSEP